MHHAGPEARGNAARLVEIGTRHIARQAVGRVVGNANRVLDVVVRDDSEHGPEYFLAGDGHVIRDIAEDRWFRIVAGVEPVRAPGAAGDQGGPFVDARLDELLHLVPLGRGDERSHLDAFVARIADLEVVCHFRSDGCRLVHPLPWHQHA